MLSTDGILCAYQMVNQFPGTNYQVVKPPKSIPNNTAKRGDANKINLGASSSKTAPPSDFWSKQSPLKSTFNFGSGTTLSSFNNITSSVSPITTANSKPVFEFSGGKSSVSAVTTVSNCLPKTNINCSPISESSLGLSVSATPGILQTSPASGFGMNLKTSISTVAPSTSLNFLPNNKLMVDSGNDAFRKHVKKPASSNSAVSFNFNTSTAATIPDQSNFTNVGSQKLSFLAPTECYPLSTSSISFGASVSSVPLTAPSLSFNVSASQVHNVELTPVLQNKQLKSISAPLSFDKKSFNPIEQNTAPKQLLVSSNIADDMEIKIFSDKLETALQKNILEELNGFNNELEVFLKSISDINHQRELIGTQLELQQIKKSVEDIDCLVSKYKACMTENNKESCELRNNLLLNFKNVDEAKLQKEKMEDKRLSLVLKSRPLDPISSRQQKVIRDQMNDIIERLDDVNMALDEEWKKNEMKKKNIHTKNSNFLQNQQVYKTVDAIDQITSNISNRLKSLTLKSEENQLLLINRTLGSTVLNEKKKPNSSMTDRNLPNNKSMSQLKTYLSRRSKTPIRKSRLCNSLLIHDDLNNTVYLPLNGNIHPKAASTPFVAADNSKLTFSSMSTIFEEKPGRIGLKTGKSKQSNNVQAATSVSIPEDQKNNLPLIVTKKLFVESPVPHVPTEFSSISPAPDKHEPELKLPGSIKLMQDNHADLKMKDSSSKTFGTKHSVDGSYPSKSFIDGPLIRSSNNSTKLSTSKDVLVSSDPSNFNKSFVPSHFSNLFDFTPPKTGTFNLLHSSAVTDSSSVVFSSGLFASVSTPVSSNNLIGPLSTLKESSNSILSAAVTTTETSENLFGSAASFRNGLFVSNAKSIDSSISFSTITTSLIVTAPTGSLGSLFESVEKTAISSGELSASTTSTGSSGGLFSISSSKISTVTSTGLFGSSSTLFTLSPSSTGGLFSSSATSAGSTGTLFGSSATATSAGNLFGSNVPSTSSLFSSTATSAGSTGTLFGSSTTATSAGNLFGSNVPSTSSLFSSTATSAGSTGTLFGSTATATSSGNLFGSNAPSTGSLFSSTATSSGSIGGLFGSNVPSTGGLFSSATSAGSTGTLFSSNATATSAGNLFGSNVPSTGSFFSSTATPSVSIGGLFGSNVPSASGFFNFAATSAGSTGSLFSSNAAATTATSLFGSNVSSTGGLFSSTQSSSGSKGGLFSSNVPSAGSLFSFAGTSAGSTGSLFGSSATTTSTGGLFGSTASSTGS